MAVQRRPDPVLGTLAAEAWARVVSLWWRWVVFGPVPLVRWLLQWQCAGDIALVRPHFDGEFYCRQLHRPGMRRAADRDQVLHYLLVGAPRLLSPHPGFDAVRHFHATSRVRRGQVFIHALRTYKFPGPEPQAAPQGQGAAAGRALLLDHSRGGGATRYLDLYAAVLEGEGFRLARAVRSAAVDPLFMVEQQGRYHVFSLDERDLADVVAQLGITRLVINHFVDMPDSVVATLPATARRLGIGYELLVHDYYLACPRIVLIDREGRFCDLPDAAACTRCLGGGETDISAWRNRADAAMRGAARVTVPSQDIAWRLGRVFPEATFRVHEPESEPLVTPLPRRCGDGQLRIGVIGAIGVAKGFNVVADLARLARRQGCAVEFVLIGHSMNDVRLRWAGVSVRGRYADHELDEHLCQARLDCIFFPAIWPETWSFTLTAALRWGGPVAAFDLGAIADRLRRAGQGTLLPLALSDDPAVLLDELMGLARTARGRTIAPAEPI